MDNLACIPGPLSDNQRNELRDSNQSSVMPLNSTSSAFEVARLVKKSAGKLYGAQLFNQNVAARFALFFDLGAVPSNGAASLFTVPLAIGAAGSVYFGSVGRAFEQGLVVVLSTTAGTLTTAGADMWCDVQYV